MNKDFELKEALSTICPASSGVIVGMAGAAMAQRLQRDPSEIRSSNRTSGAKICGEGKERCFCVRRRGATCNYA